MNSGGVVTGACALVLVTVAASGCRSSAGAEPAAERAAETAPVRREPIRPIPLQVDSDPAKAELGRALFHDPRLSGDGTVSCASCHQLATGGDDGRRVSIGVHGRRGTLNAPTVLNARFNFRQFWDGRADSLESQVAGPLQSGHEMASSWDHVIDVLRTDARYRARFAAVYSDGVTPANVANAIAEFERTLVTPGSPFDRWLRGENHALGDAALRGYQLFKGLGCTSCHQGVNVGGNMYENLGVMGDYWEGREPSVSDLGRFNVTGSPEDRFVFKVPGLRNVALTAPYFHDGRVETLDDAVRLMARLQLGRELTDEQVADVVAFLGTLTGELPR